MDLASSTEVVLAASRHWEEMSRCRYAEAFQSIQFVTSNLL